MKKLMYYPLLVGCWWLGACNWFEVRQPGAPVVVADTVVKLDSATAKMDTIVTEDTVKTKPIAAQDATQNKDTALLPPAKMVRTGAVQPGDVVAFAQTLVGTPYVYASTNPAVGFDCSGFITYVFNHFSIAVPRSSVDFTDVGSTTTVADAQPGDLILFTGTDSTERHVGHMGLVVSNTDTLKFIHSSSGKAMGVVITSLNGYYKSRFVRIARIFPQTGQATTHETVRIDTAAHADADSIRTTQPTPRHHRHKARSSRHQSGTRQRRRK